MAFYTGNLLIMDISTKTLILGAAVLLIGLSAGLFYAWSVSVIPGTKKVPDLTYLETMQSINRAILNPAFFLVFFGSMVLLSISTMYEYHGHRWSFDLILIATILYLCGTIGVTGFGNVPLNNQLEALKIGEMSPEKMKGFRAFYEAKWNRLHQIRTVFAVLSFTLTLIALLGVSPKN